MSDFGEGRFLGPTTFPNPIRVERGCRKRPRTARKIGSHQAGAEEADAGAPGPLVFLVAIRHAMPDGYEFLDGEAAVEGEEYVRAVGRPPGIDMAVADCRNDVGIVAACAPVDHTVPDCQHDV